MATATPTRTPPPAQATPASQVKPAPVAPPPERQADAAEQELFRGDKIAVILFIAGFVALVFLLLCDLFVGISR